MAEPDALSTREINDELNKISTLNGWGFVGVILPIVGFICAGVAHSRAKKLQILLGSDNNNKYVRLARARQTTSSIIVLLSILSLGVFLISYVHVSQIAEAEREREARVQQEQVDSANSARAARQSALSSCLVVSEEKYNSGLEMNATSTRVDQSGKTVYSGEQDIFNRISDEKRADDNDCYARYPQ